MTTRPRIRRLHGIRLPDGRVVDLGFDGLGRIDSLGDANPAALDAAGEGVIDGRGLLALPGLVNAHAHVDKSWWGLPWQPYGGEGGTEGRIRHERERRGELGIPGLEITRAVLGQFVVHGTTALRTHVDVDTGIGLRGVEIVREALSEYGDALQWSIVAFPQDGVLRRPGTLELLATAARDGLVDHVGGLDPAGIDRDPVGQLDAILGLAAEHGVGVDIHLHDARDLGAFQVELILERTEALGLHGRVTIAHGFAIAQVDEPRRRDLLQAMGALGVGMTTVAPLGLPQLPLRELDAASVPIELGTDGIRDLWSPYGTGDLLGIARQFARASGLARDEDLRRVVEIATSPTPFVRSAPDIAPFSPGARADVVLVDAENVMDALVRTPPREVVIGGGVLLHGS